MTDNRYIGVTIGPIFDVMNLANTPASLWASSYLFSYLSKCICEELVKRGVLQEDIIAPYYDSTCHIIDDMAKEGVGLFHDHIVFKQKNFPLEKMSEVRTAAIDRLYEAFDVGKKYRDARYLDNFIMISCFEFEAGYSVDENPLMICGKIFDSIELSKKFVPRETNGNPILELFTGIDENRKAENTKDKENALTGKTFPYDEKKNNIGRNERIKSVAIYKLGCENWQMLLKTGGRVLKSIHDLQSKGYYAVVRADGDDVGKYISSLKSDEEIRLFSKECYSCFSEITKRVKEFGGITIYAGGDDLLAIMPCINNDGSKTILDFVSEAQGFFRNNLSFGIFVCYEKFPLYEALRRSAGLLYVTAKNRIVGDELKKNNTVIFVQNHSGQTESFIIGNETIGELLATQHLIVSARAGGNDQGLISALQKIALFRELLKIAAETENEDHIQALFDNMFDGNKQETTFLRNVLSQLFIDIIGKKIDIKAIGDENYNEADTLKYLLRMLKFFIERGAKW